MRGLELARRFYAEAVAPLVARVAPALRYTAGRFGPCSDVIGFDDEISRDHNWGASCMLLVEHEPLALEVPPQFLGHATSVEVVPLQQYLRGTFGVDAMPLRVTEWLAIDEQRLVEVTGGELFRDDLGFAEIRRALAHYPDDLRRHLIAAEWIRIADEQAFPARAGSRRDAIGSAIISARLAESAMRLAFYLARTYPPYAKWFGSAFAKLPSAARLQPPLARVLTGPSWEERDGAWADVMRELIGLHEQAGLIRPGIYAPASVYPGRPGTGLPQLESRGLPTIGQLIEEVRAPIRDPEVLALPPRVGSINQVVAVRDLEDHGARWRSWFGALPG